ncbi:putative cholesterol 7-alpha-monooxygenase [Amylocarpus encephaloides]|uniref:Cholesterol 7-alpha-monooxygenase n=1 Tax=Amylocarpus encephaloides TaxID=45428 RepID=A0A9P8CA73_9HELO|nr:putative cholesterol 7-alpha-monooxygenase [Amylocarpus encephaloides]
MLFTLEDTKLSRGGQAIAMLPLIWAINSNAIPCTIWILLEALKRPGMFQRLRKEVAPSMRTDDSGKLTIDIPSLLANSPLLYAMYLETLRACTSSTVTRRVAEDTECDGYILKTGSHIMSPSWLPAHGAMWDVPGHPAKQFWPERFIEMPKHAPRNPDEKTAYETAMRPENFFPYGGGNVICSGRFFAKQEIMAAVAIFITKFDIEFQGWVTLRGKTSDREARPDETLAGAGVLPPDRDMMVSVKRIS